jgi:hypothetical protein
MFFMDWFCFELVQVKRTKTGQGREAKLRLRMAGSNFGVIAFDSDFSRNVGADAVCAGKLELAVVRFNRTAAH